MLTMFINDYIREQIVLLTESLNNSVFTKILANSALSIVLCYYTFRYRAGLILFLANENTFAF